MTSEVVFCWPLSSFHGWGIRGMGMALNWDGLAVSAMGQDAELPAGDPRQQLLSDRMSQSRRFQNEILPKCPDVTELGASVLIPLGNDLTELPVAHKRRLRGKPTIACPVFEDVDSVRKNVAKLRQYDAVVVASEWNRDFLDGFGIKARLCHEGIDPLIFNPSVRKKRNDGRFRVFSGGKAEYRKGQDIVIEAFKLFAQKHDDAVLVACWSSPFGAKASDFEGKYQYGAPPGTHIGMPNFGAWLQRAGLKPHQFEIVSPRPNWQMAEVYGSCDVALFPNRREGGTSFPTMEAMACGLPTILRLDYGMADLADEGYQFSYRDTRDSAGLVADLLKDAYMFRGPIVGLSDHWTWARHCDGMARIAASVS